MSERIVVVGSANADVVVGVDRRPGAGETVLGGDTVLGSGGKGANSAVAAARLGGDVALLGAIGTDGYGDLLAGALAESGVDIAALRRVDGPSGAAYITVTPDGENSIIVSPGANSALSESDVDERVLAGAGVLLTQLEIPIPVVCRAIELAHAAGVRCVCNASPVAELPAATLAALDVLLVNEHEAGWLLGGRTGEPGELATALRALGPRSVVLTLGARGAVLSESSDGSNGSNGGVIEVPAPSVSTVDTTGAGDAFAGALALRLAAGAPLRAAAEFAARVAAVSVTRAGTQSSYPTPAELD